MPPETQPRPIAIAASMLDRALRRRLAGDLPGALRRGELAVHYQPRVRLRDGTCTGAEALLRWCHAQYGDVPPSTFIPLAEGSDLIVALGGWVLRQATADAAAWPELGRVSVNISARQVATGILPEQVATALAASGLPPERLELELTESLSLEHDAAEVAILHDLRDLGIGLALDDFGTGFASYGRLRRLPFTALKLDRSLIAPLPGQAADMAIVAGIRDLGRALRLRLVAEGVERPEQRDALIDIGFDEAQGYLFGAAMPLASFHHGAMPHLAQEPGSPTLGSRCPLPESPSSVPASPA